MRTVSVPRNHRAGTADEDPPTCGYRALYPAEHVDTLRTADLLGRCLSRPDTSDGISEDRTAAAVVIAESVGMAIATTFAYALLGSGLGLVDDSMRRAQLLYLILLPLTAVMIYRLSAASSRQPDA